VAAAALALGSFATAASAAPALDQDAYDALGGSEEWPLIEAEWIAGPVVPGADLAPSSFSVSALTADSCEAVLPDPTDGLVKTATRTQLTPTQMRLRVQLDTTEAAGNFRLRDCIWIDDGDGVWEEPSETLFGIDVEPFVWVPDAGDGIGSFARFSVNLPVTAQQAVCDRAARSSLEEGPTVPLLRSNTLCLTPDPDPVVPEAATVVLLPLSAAGLGVACWFLLRRRRPVLAA
jgi:hypothetical protein